MGRKKSNSEIEKEVKTFSFLQQTNVCRFIEKLKSILEELAEKQNFVIDEKSEETETKRLENELRDYFEEKPLQKRVRELAEDDSMWDNKKMRVADELERFV